jgi:hypothetical protein
LALDLERQRANDVYEALSLELEDDSAKSLKVNTKKKLRTRRAPEEEVSCLVMDLTCIESCFSLLEPSCYAIRLPMHVYFVTFMFLDVVMIMVRCFLCQAGTTEGVTTGKRRDDKQFPQTSLQQNSLVVPQQLLQAQQQQRCGPVVLWEVSHQDIDTDLKKIFDKPSSAKKGKQQQQLLAQALQAQATAQSVQQAHAQLKVIQR